MSKEKIQLGIAVKDLEQAVARAEQLFGIGPFRFLDVPEAGVRAAVADWAGVELEYIVATNEHTKANHDKLLSKQDAKLTHIGVYVDDKDGKTQHFQSLDVPVVYDDVGTDEMRTSMVDLRNEATHGHIITIEDPIEFTHSHKNCLITQREIGLDTASYGIAMKNTLRQAPDVILLGEVRDRESMEYAIAYAETGHLCLTTLHANSTNQAIDRIINFFPDERKEQLLMDLSLNLKAIVSQRLTRKKDGKGRFPAVEVLLNTPMMADLILKGDVSGMKELMAKSNQLGMCTFDQALFHMIDSGLISVQEGMRNADSINDLRLKLKLGSRKSKKEDFFKGADSISIEELYDEAAE